MGVRIPPPVQNKVNIMLKYFSEAFEELKSNVTWPAWAEVQKYTIIVALFSVIFALATWGVDLTFTKVLNGFFNLLKG
ncbi:preprotein translocase subunit SecE [Flavobacterium sp. F372]|jgi:preprotein translocase subunit SecE|uniref:Protein translocase subunit SecE n=2 Tax=Flavobacteriaceae TaxID=49546 RepID=A0ABR7IXS2_9FLAO|nr:preprotein translocase subunit SecE [Flavobacterium bernardetii]NHF70232.1 preprotein translocase subunit SecE [Flavobacterium bernardetii]